MELFKDCYAIIIKRAVLVLCLLQGAASMGVIAANLKVKVANATDTSLLVVLLRTKSDTDYNIRYGSMEGKVDAVKARLIKSKASITFDNFPRGEDYDRVLWVVPLTGVSIDSVKNVVALGTALVDRSRVDQPAVKAFEVGSASEITISRDKDKLKSATKGKWLGAAKSMIDAAKNYASNDEQIAKAVAQPKLAGGYDASALAKGSLSGDLKEAAEKAGSKIKAAVAKAKKAVKGAIGPKNPADWPDNANMGFAEVVDALGLSSAQTTQLAKYAKLKEAEQQQLKDGVKESMEASEANATLKAKAFSNYLKYTTLRKKK